MNVFEILSYMYVLIRSCLIFCDSYFSLENNGCGLDPHFEV